MRESQIEAAERALVAAEAAELRVLDAEYRRRLGEVAAMSRYKRALPALALERGNDPAYAEEIEPATGLTWADALTAERTVAQLIARGELPPRVEIEVAPLTYRRLVLSELAEMLERGWDPKLWTGDWAADRREQEE